MSKKFVNLLGILTGILAIIFSIVIFATAPGSTATHGIHEIETSGVTPETEEDSYYGGDAYTGMQQASAQAATNLVAVYDSIEQTNANLETLNENLNETLNENQDKWYSHISTAFGFLLLIIGLLTIVKYLGLFVSDLNSAKKTELESSISVNPVQAHNAFSPTSSPFSPVQNQQSSMTNEQRNSYM